MGADAHGDEPFFLALLGAVLKALRIAQLATSTFFASAISTGVNRRTNTGCLRNTALMACPGWIALMSISVELSARTSAEGFIWLTRGTRTLAAPTPAAPVAAT
jgi:hypothetical protein